MKKNKQFIILAIIAIVIVLIWLLVRGDDKEQIVGEINNNWIVANIHHIEVIDDNKSVAFFKTVDGTEKEMYLEKLLFTWKNKRRFFF